MHVPRHLACVRENGVAADLAVVRKMHVRHDPVVVADAGDADILGGAAVDRDIFADRIAVSDLNRGGLVSIFLVLRRSANGRELVDAVCPADPGVPLEDDVRPDPRSLTDLHVLPDDRKRADLHAVRDPCAGMDDGRRMYRHRPGLQAPGALRTEHSISASQTMPWSTRAVHANFQTPRTPLSSVTSISSWSPGTTGFLNLALSIPAR